MPSFYHFTNIGFTTNKIYNAKKKHNLYFGDYEKLYEKYRPNNAPSRLSAFFLVKNKDLYFGEQFGINKFLVESENYHTCYLF